MQQQLSHIAREAGAAILRARTSLQIQTKADNSPVSNADVASHRVLREQLAKLDDIPVLSEEEPVAYNIRKHWSSYWLVDPLDGTQGFIKGSNEYCINIARISKGRPTLACLYVPYSDDSYTAAVGEGVQKNGVPLSFDKWPSRTEVSDVLLGRSKLSVQTQALLGRNGFTQVHKQSAALKFVSLIELAHVVYYRNTPCYEWDVAAGELLCQEAGFSAYYDFKPGTYAYNQEDLSMPPFVFMPSSWPFSQFNF